MEDTTMLDDVMQDCTRILSLCRRRPQHGASRLTGHQTAILSHLQTAGPLAVAGLAKRLGVTLSTMSLSLDRLVRQGCVQRRRDPVDRRRVNIILTDLGRQQVSRGTMLDGDRMRSALASLTPEQRKLATSGLALLARAAAGTDTNGSSPEPPAPPQALEPQRAPDPIDEMMQTTPRFAVEED